ncbi:MAG: Maf family protein [Elusimicrobiota bacterium]|jgi:septum formation protein|nr:Maf family protein [Elusimicrobiota bacterium]
MRLILASCSPRRQAILKSLGYKFDIIPTNIEETSSKARPHAIVRELALKKAFSVALKYPNAVVIGGDTLVYCKGEILGKPKNKKDALKMLSKENGSWQSVYSALALVCVSQNKILQGHDITKCKARRLSKSELLELAGKHMDKAGAYAMQDKGDMFIEKVKGSYTNVVGMPSELFEIMIKEF